MSICVFTTQVGDGKKWHGGEGKGAKKKEKLMSCEAHLYTKM